MNIKIARDDLLKPLAHIAGVVEKRQTLPILSNVYLKMEDGALWLTGTDMEVEVTGRAAGAQGDAGEVTVGARKLMDICRALPEGAEISLTTDGTKALIRSGRSRFTLQTLPPEDFPRIETEAWGHTLTGLDPVGLRELFEKTAFAMAVQDVRYFLNGLLLELRPESLRAVATDGHRLAMSDMALGASDEIHQAIVPRKAVLELIRLLADTEQEVVLRLSGNHVRMEADSVVFTSKLIDGRYPEYAKVIPEALPVAVSLDRQAFRETLQRAAILTNEKFRGVRLTLAPGVLRVTAHNPDQEEASDEMEAEYDGSEVEVGFNVNYLLDALGALKGRTVDFMLRDQNTSCTLRSPEDPETLYLVMPMRL